MTRRSFSTNLLEWYAANKRALPWRRTRDPYRIWISETLLQQTLVQTVIPYYHRFLRRFPTVRALAAAPLDEVLKAWEGAGYYARARNLHRAALMVLDQFAGRIPRTARELRTLPGVGRYTANAVASIAFGEDVPVVDGNVARVLCRYYGVRGDPRTGPVERELFALAEALVPRGRAGDFNQAMMELGATVCLPRSPQCGDCPVRRGCAARRLGMQDQLPFKRAAKQLPHYDIGIGIVWRRGRVLIQQRPPKGLLGGLWEFPGGKRERGESFAACVKREAEEEVGLCVEVGREIAVVNHGYSHMSVTLHAFNCEHVSGRVRLRAATAYKWVRPDELGAYAFPAANRRIIKKLEGQ